MSNSNNTSYGSVSPQLDELSSTLMGEALDMLAEGQELNVILALQSADGEVQSYVFADDSPERLLEAARQRVRSARTTMYYAFVYEGAVQEEDGSFADALFLEFGERGCPSFSAYSLFEGRGEGNAFRWTDPAPAGEEEPLLG